MNTEVEAMRAERDRFMEAAYVESVRKEKAEAEVRRLREGITAHTVTLHDTVSGLIWSCTCSATGAGDRARVKAAAQEHLRALLDGEAR